MYYKSKGNRRVEINHTLRDYKTKVNELLKSEQGIYHRKKEFMMLSQCLQTSNTTKTLNDLTYEVTKKLKLKQV